MSDFVPELIAFEIFYCPNIQMVSSGLSLPLAARSLRGIVMTDVLHHMPQPRLFFTEAARCVRPGGVIAMIEPGQPLVKICMLPITPRTFHRKLYHGNFRPASFSGANDALPWIILARDRQKFEQEFPQWQVEQIKPMCLLLTYFPVAFLFVLWCPDGVSCSAGKSKVLLIVGGIDWLCLRRLSCGVSTDCFATKISKFKGIRLLEIVVR